MLRGLAAVRHQVGRTAHLPLLRSLTSGAFRALLLRLAEGDTAKYLYVMGGLSTLGQRTIDVREIVSEWPSNWADN